ncbi:MAG: hypothetical protein AMXMBFR84_12240 [Candidatus Hydrogenedentota bacterium]
MLNSAHALTAGFEVVTRHIVMEKDLNAYGNVFGGTMLAWLDEAAALFAMESTGYPNMVTVNLNNVDFRAPARRGDTVVIYAKSLKTGRSSLTLDTMALVHDHALDEKRLVIHCEVTFVCLKDGKPYAYFSSPEYQARAASAQSKSPDIDQPVVT